jgi:hypothetical protein
MSHYLTEFTLPIGEGNSQVDGTACGDVIDLGYTIDYEHGWQRSHDGYEIIVMACQVCMGPSTDKHLNQVDIDYDKLPDMVQEEIDRGLVEDYRA